MPQRKLSAELQGGCTCGTTSLVGPGTGGLRFIGLGEWSLDCRGLGGILLVHWFLPEACLPILLHGQTMRPNANVPSRPRRGEGRPRGAAGVLVRSIPWGPLAIALERTGAKAAFATGEEFESRLPARTIPGVEGRPWAFSGGHVRDRATDRTVWWERRPRPPPIALRRKLCVPHCVVGVYTATLERERPDLVVFEPAQRPARPWPAYATGVRAVCLFWVGWRQEWSMNLHDAVEGMIRAPGASALADVLIDPAPALPRRCRGDTAVSPRRDAVRRRGRRVAARYRVAARVTRGSAGVSDHGEGSSKTWTCYARRALEIAGSGCDVLAAHRAWY